MANIEKASLVLLGSAPVHEVTADMNNLARSLSQLHGTVMIMKETNGIHFYMASPICLKQEGSSELQKRHLAVNATKFFRGQQYVAMCMKTGQAYSVDDLLNMPPLSERGFKDSPLVMEIAAVNQDFLEQDAAGRWVPKSPGKVVPVFQLANDHPARQYLAYRKFDPEKLYQQFRLSYCYEERTDVYYRKLLNGFKGTSQGRIVFYCDQLGVSHGWQARILEIEHENKRYYFHPYRNEWVAVAMRDGNEWQELPGWEEWDPCKYFIGHGARRNSMLMGLDAAVACSQTHRDREGRKFCVLAEGPLDAGRLGPPAIALLGKHISHDQAEQLSQHFNHVIYVPDNDAAGQAALQKVATTFARFPGVRVDFAKVPEGTKDLGEMTEEEAWSIITPFI